MTKNRREFLAAAVLLCGGAALLGGCNTVEGVGKDIERAGDAIEDEAREQRRNN
jgi:predicted small secreted protein